MQNPSPAIPALLHSLWRHLAPRRRKQFGLLTVLVLVSAFAEVVSLGAVLPFLGILTAPERVFRNPAVVKLAHLWCDQVLDLREGKIAAMGTFGEFMDKSPTFKAMTALA